MWRLGDVDGVYLSLAHKDGQTAMVWKEDGTQMSGPRNDLTPWAETAPEAELLDLTNADTKDSQGEYDPNSKKAVDGVISDSGLSWGSCGHWTSVANPWWMVDLGEERLVTKVKLYNRNDCCKDRLQDVNIYLGGSTTDYTSNTEVASDIDVVVTLEVDIDATGRYLWVARPARTGLTICEIQVWATANMALRNVMHGDNFVQMGTFWRLGDVDGVHMSIGHAGTQKTAMVYTNNGDKLPGPRVDYGMWDRVTSAPLNLNPGNFCMREMHCRAMIAMDESLSMGMNWNRLG